MSYRPPSLAEITATLEPERREEHLFLAGRLDNPAHHIIGGHIAGQALMAASRTAPRARVARTISAVAYVVAGRRTRAG